MKQMFKVLPGCELYAKLEDFWNRYQAIAKERVDVFAMAKEHGINVVKYQSTYEHLGGIEAFMTYEKSDLFKCKRDKSSGMYVMRFSEKSPSDLREAVKRMTIIPYQDLCDLFGVKSGCFIEETGYIFQAPSLRKGTDGIFYATFIHGLNVPEQEGLIKL